MPPCHSERSEESMDPSASPQDDKGCEGCQVRLRMTKSNSLVVLSEGCEAPEVEWTHNEVSDSERSVHREVA